MKKILCKTALTAVLLLSGLFMLQGQNFTFTDNWGEQGLTIESQTNKGLELNYSVTAFRFTEQEVKGEPMKKVELPGTLLPNDAGMPDLPGNGHLIAIPRHAEVSLKVADYKVQTYENVEIAPAPVIPLDTEKGPLKYEKNEKIYNSDQFYPADPFKLSEKFKIRGVDVVTLGVTPFQYNPVTKTLKVYRDVRLSVTFNGGKNKFGIDKYRSRFWEPILKNNLVNYSALPEIDYNKINAKNSDDEAAYVILTIDNENFIAKAHEIAEFRRKQGISTRVITTDDAGGNNIDSIESWIDNAYNNWDNPPEALLILGDYSTGSDGIISKLYTHSSPYISDDYASDNYFADVDGDYLPDIVFARIAAEDTSQLNTMVSKFINYEQNPPEDEAFYNNPITALGWQTERWFQICSEVIGGFWQNELNKEPVRINAVYEGDPSTDPWSTATNTSTVMNYFGPDGLGYIPETPSELGNWTGGTAGDVVNAINNGAFMLQHRDHGMYTGWGEPAFTNANISSLQNTGNKLPFIFSINCQTGAFHNPGADPSFTEALHRYTYNGQNSGALGLIAATEASYSFVNDTYVWGLYDNMWPDFMPGETSTSPVDFVYPAFGNTAAKYFLYQSSWPYNEGSKIITYKLFHHHGDAYLNVFTEQPQSLTVTAPDSHIYGNNMFYVTADEGAQIAVTYYDETENRTIICGTAVGTGSETAIPLAQIPNPGTNMLITATKQNYYRYSESIPVITSSGPYIIVDDFTINDGANNQAEYAENFNLDVSIKNVGADLAENITMSLQTTDQNVAALTNATNIGFGNLNPDEISTSSESFNVQLEDNINDQEKVKIDVIISDQTSENYESQITFDVNAPKLIINEPISIADPTGNNNSILDPGETADVTIDVTNEGHAEISNVIGELTTSSPYLNIHTATTESTTLSPGESGSFIFNISAIENASDGTAADMNFSVSGGNNSQYAVNETKTLIIGFVPEYCEATAETTSDEYIQRVQFLSIDNESESDGYADYTHMAADVTYGDTDSIKITNGDHWDGDQMGCWIDWNYDGDFADENETIEIAYTEPVGTGIIEVPDNAYAGELRMRIRITYSGSPEPCGTSSYGEVEDYSLNVTPNIYAGYAMAEPDEICKSEGTQLTLLEWIGDEVKWQKSLDGSNWNFISGANSDTHQISVLTQSYYYRAQVNADDAEPVYSNVVEVNVHEYPSAGFSYDADSLQVSFINESTDADSYIWTFGDDTESAVVANPVHTYAEDGNYTVTLEASNGVCPDDITQQQVFVSANAINAINQIGLDIYPNPSKGILTVTSNQDVEMKLLDNTGKIQMSKTIQKPLEKINISHLAEGVYILKFSTDNRIMYRKIIKK